MSRHYRALAGNLELFLGAYFIAFGFLAMLYFTRLDARNGIVASAAGVLLGLLLVLRARSLLGWHRWIFWFVVLLMIGLPIAWLAPALMAK